MAEAKPDWVKIKPAELEKIVIDLHKQENTPAKIGLILRDNHGIPKAKILGRKITRILKEAEIDFISEKALMKKKIEKIEKHISIHKHDYTAKRSLGKKLWAIHRLVN